MDTKSIVASLAFGGGGGSYIPLKQVSSSWHISGMNAEEKTIGSYTCTNKVKNIVIFASNGTNCIKILANGTQIGYVWGREIKTLQVDLPAGTNIITRALNSSAGGFNGGSVILEEDL